MIQLYFVLENKSICKKVRTCSCADLFKKKKNIYIYIVKAHIRSIIFRILLTFCIFPAFSCPAENEIALVYRSRYLAISCLVNNSARGSKNIVIMNLPGSDVRCE